MATDKHICPKCDKWVHGICGKEDLTEDLQHRTICFLCFDLLSNELGTAVAAAGGTAKRATDTSLHYDPSDEDDDNCITVIDSLSLSGGTKSTTSKTSSSVLSKQPIPRPNQ